MRWSRVGMSNKTRLVWSKYYKYILKGEEFYIKEKAYITRDDGWIDSQEIKKQTYRNAIKRGNECFEILVEENILDVPVRYLVIMLSHIYKTDNPQIGYSIVKAMEETKKIKEQSTISPLAEYKIFKSLFEEELDKEVQHK